MSENYYTLPGLPSDLIRGRVGGERAFKSIPHVEDPITGILTPAKSAHGCQLHMTFLTAISGGHVPGISIWYSLGYNPNVTTARVDICEWGGIYIPPASTGIQMRVVSSNAADNGNLNLTGVWTARIEYLDVDGYSQTTDLILNGLTPVNTVPTDIRRVNSFHTITADITTLGYGEAKGNILLTNLAGTITYAQISIGSNFSRHGFYTIPVDKVGYVSGALCSVGGTTSGRFLRTELRATCDPDGNLTPSIFMFLRNALLVDQAKSMDFEIPHKLPPLCDIKFSAVDENGSYASSYVEGWLEDVA